MRWEVKTLKYYVISMQRNFDKKISNVYYEAKFDFIHCFTWKWAPSYLKKLSPLHLHRSCQVGYYCHLYFIFKAWFYVWRRTWDWGPWMDGSSRGGKTGRRKIYNHIKVLYTLIYIHCYWILYVQSMGR